MRKLILSAFAMSLCLLIAPVNGQTQQFLGLESELLPLLPGEERFTRPEIHQDRAWNVKEHQAIQISGPMKGQNHSTVSWKNINPEKWMDFDIWKNERTIKDQLPDWQLRIRQHNQNEHIGKVLQCRGECQNYRSDSVTTSVYQSRINEGDEFHTSKNSGAWIYLIDGSLMRIGPESSVTFQEINLSQNEFLTYVRLNQGHIYWHPRSNLNLPEHSLPETDIFSLPLVLKEANQEFFERKVFQSQNDSQHLGDVLNLNRLAIEMQIKELEDLRNKNNSITIPVTQVIVVSPQVTIISKKTSFDLLYLPGHKTYLKRRTKNDGDEFQIALRGYTNTDLIPLDELAWHSLDKSGRSYEKIEDVPVELQLIELLTARIKTIELAREYWFEKYTSNLLRLVLEKDEKKIASDYGYLLWKEDYAKRINFLLEYSRRMETTYLRALENLALKLENKGEAIGSPLDQRFHKAALNEYLIYLKKRYSVNYTQVREMSDLQYYIWVLKRGSGVVK